MISFNVTRNQGRDIEFSGLVNAPNPSQTEVRLSGAASAIVSVNAAGSYSGSATTVGFGQISARMFNLQGTPISKSLTYDFQNWAPTVFYQVAQTGPGQFGVSGAVGDEDPQLALVNVGGIGNGTATPNGNGNFNFTINGAMPGLVNVQTVDSMGLPSPVVTLPALNLPPVLTSFTASHFGNEWHLDGTVADEYPAGLVVTFQSTIPMINGQTAVVQSNGTFGRVFFLKAGQLGGFAYANTSDWFGAGSNTLAVYVG